MRAPRHACASSGDVLSRSERFTAFGAIYARELGLGRVGLIFLFASVVIAIRAFGRRIPDLFGAKRAATMSLILVASGLLVIAGYDALPGLFLGTAILAAGHALAFPADVPGVSPLLGRRAKLGRRHDRRRVAAAIGGCAILLGSVASLMGYRMMFVASASAAIVGLTLLRRL